MTAAVSEPTSAPDLGADERPFLATGPYVAPFVNLLPPEVAQRKALRKLQALFAAGVIACGAVVGGLYVLAHNGQASAQASLDQAVSQGNVLEGTKARLQPSQIARAQIQSTKQALVSAMSAEVLWSRYLDQLRLQLPDGVRLTSLTLTPTAGTTGGTSSTPAAPASSTPASSASSTSGAGSPTAVLPTSGTIAAVTITGRAVDHDAVANWLDALDRIPGWFGSYLSNTTSAAATGSTGSAGSTSGLVDFTVTANVDAQALSHRYTNGS